MSKNRVQDSSESPKPLLHCVELSMIPILQQLQYEEALLRVDQRNWCLFNTGSPPAIVMGISGVVDQLIHLEKLKNAPIPLIRRFSGGGTVVVDENTLFVTFICQASALNIPPFPRPLMEWTSTLYNSLFPFPQFKLEENDYTIENRKWGGNAQSIVKGRWLHHSSLLWDFNPRNMEYLLIPQKMPKYRQHRSHDDFLCRLKDYFPKKEILKIHLYNQLQEHFSLVEERGEVIEKINEMPHRKVTALIDLEVEKTPPKGVDLCTINTACAGGSAS